MIQKVIGIDPGLSGSAAILRYEDGAFASMHVFDTPTVSPTKGKRQFYLSGMRSILASARISEGRGHVSVEAVLEAVHAFKGQGVSSTFNFGAGWGMWQGLLGGLEIPFELVTPQRWKGAMLDGTTKDKALSRIKASQLYPAYADLFARVKDDGRAEAVLMATYYARTALRVVKSDTWAAEMAEF